MLGALFLGRVNKKKNKKGDPCSDLKAQLEVAQSAHGAATKQITLQELLIAQLQKEIEDVNGKLAGKVKAHAKDVAGNIKDELVKQEKSGVLKEVVGVAEEAKALYDDLSEKYTQAKELLAVLKARQAGFADEVREREALFNMCIQGTALASRAASPLDSELLSGDNSDIMNRVVHFEIHVDDPERAMKFYADVFGWTFMQWGERKYWMVMTAPKESTEPGINGGLLPRSASMPHGVSGANAFVCTVQVENFDEIAKKIIAAKGAVTMPKYALVGMAWQGYFLDTEGNTFGIHEADVNAK